MDLKIKDKIALITGATGGIGMATASDLINEGATLILTDMDKEALQQSAKTLGGNVHFKSADLTNDDDISSLVEFCQSSVGMPDILINCAGTTGAKGHPLADITDDDWAEAWTIDFMAVVKMCRAFMPSMANNGWGRVVAIASENAVQPYWDEAVYNTAKASLLNFFKGLSREYSKDGVLVNTVSPAFIETPMTDGMMEKRAKKNNISKEKAIKTFLDEERPYLELKRRGQPDEVAAAIVFLCSERASFINGSNLRVDGGAVATMQT